VQKDSITGLLLAGVGHINEQQKKNFLIVDSSACSAPLKSGSCLLAYRDTSVYDRVRISGVYRTPGHRYPAHHPNCTRLPLRRLDHWLSLIPQLADKIRPTVDKYQQAFPALLEIPSKDHPYGSHIYSTRLSILADILSDPSKDSVLKRVQKLFGE